MKILELFAGSRSIGKAAESLGHEVFSVDINPFDKIDLVQDIEYLTTDQIPFKPDMIWASPPCTSYSIAAAGHHRRYQTPLSDFARKSDRMMLNLLDIIEKFNCVYYIENPRGLMRKMDFMKGFARTTIWYCKYGDFRAKPTDIWTNNLYSFFNPNGWQPRPKCFNNNVNCHHESAPRGSATGTQGIKGNYERSKLPVELCIEVIKATEVTYESINTR